MSDYSIGISGLNAAQRALDIIGNNIANAATEGYHRQRIDLSPAYSAQMGPVLIGGGVDVAGVTRMIDNILEQGILQQQALLEQTGSELATLRTVETAFGELSSDSGLNAVIEEFFSALRDLSAHPAEPMWQNQAVSSAQSLASKFRTLSQFLANLQNQINQEAQNTIEQVNLLIDQIAGLNDDIGKMEIGGGAQANNLRDQRDQTIVELAKLVGVQAFSREYGVVDVTIADMPVVTGSTGTELELGQDENGRLGICLAGTYSYTTALQGGQLAGLLSLKNDILADVQSNLDSLASAIISQVNQYHAQGVGSAGSFTELTGWMLPSQDFADLVPPVTDGTIYIRVADTATGNVTRTAIPVDLTGGTLDSLSELADYIDTNVTGVNASVVSSRLQIQAQSGYKFDFLPGVLTEPTTSNLAAEVSVSGIYGGSANQTYTCTVVGSGDVGNAAGLQIQVELGGQPVKTVNIGTGYAAGDRLDIGDGISISIGTGTLTAGEQFTIEALASSDTSGVLAGIGMNAFFSGTGASDIAVRPDITEAPSRIATAMGPDMTDNANILRLAALREQPISSLDDQTVGDFYRALVTDIGQQLFVKQMRQENADVIMQDLLSQQSQISGVDINDEAAKMLVFEQMFQAMARYMNTIQVSVDSVMSLIR